MTPADRLAAIGKLLHGTRWQAGLADDLGINRETIRRWLNGHTGLPADHGAFADLRLVIEARRASLDDAARLLD